MSFKSTGQDSSGRVWWDGRRVLSMCAGPDKSLYFHLRGNTVFVKTNLTDKILQTWVIAPNRTGKGKQTWLQPADTALLRNLKTMVADKAGKISFIRVNSLEVFQLANGRISKFAVIPDSREADSNLNPILNLTRDAAGNLYVLDSKSGNIWQVSKGRKVSLVKRNPKALVDSVQWARFDKEALFAATPQGEFYLTEFSDSRDVDQKQDIWFLNKAGKLLKKANGGKAYLRYADGDLTKNCLTWPYNLQADSKRNLYFADHISWIAGKTFWHFSVIRRLSPDGTLQTVAGCNSAGREGNTVVLPDRTMFPLSLNGKPFLDEQLSGGDVKDFADYSTTFFERGRYDKFDLGMELLGESNHGLFFRTGDDYYGPMFSVASTDVLFVVSETAPLIRDRIEKKVRQTTGNRIELMRIKVKKGVHCSPLTITLP